jgi:hypothetical protein
MRLLSWVWGVMYAKPRQLDPDAVKFGDSSMFRTDILTPSSRYKSKFNKKPIEADG